MDKANTNNDMAFEDLWSGTERRKHIRSPMQASIRLFHDSFDNCDFASVDISTGGVFLKYADNVEIPEIGTELEVQVMDTDVPAPRVKMRVVRKTDSGFGLEFV